MERRYFIFETKSSNNRCLPLFLYRHNYEVSRHLVELKSEFDAAEAQQKAQRWDNEHYIAWKSDEAKGYQIYTTKTDTAV